jgi:hypothetical protein
MVQPTTLSTRGLSSMKPVHDAFQSKSQNCKSRNVWTSLHGFFWEGGGGECVVMKVFPFWIELSLEMKLLSTITSQRVNARVWSGNIFICLSRKSSKCIKLQEELCLQFFWDSQ